MSQYYNIASLSNNMIPEEEGEATPNDAPTQNSPPSKHLLNRGQDVQQNLNQREQTQIINSTTKLNSQLSSSAIQPK